MIFFSNQLLTQKSSRILNISTGNPASTAKGTALKEITLYGDNQDGQLCGDFVAENLYKINLDIRGKNLFDIDNSTRKESSLANSNYENGIWDAKGNEGSGWSSFTSGEVSLNFSAIETANKTVTISLYMTLLERGKYTNVYLQCFTGPKSNYSKYQKIYYGSGESVLGQRRLYTWTLSPTEDLEAFVIRLINNRWAIEINTLQIEIGEKSTDWEPYQSSQYFDMYMPKQIGADELATISFNTGKATLVSGSETTDISNLQDWSKIPKLKNTNIITAKAEIMPSDMEITYYSRGD